MKNRLEKSSKKYEVFIYPVPFILTVLMLNVHFFLGSLYKPNIIYTSLNVLAAILCFLWAAHLTLRLWRYDGNARSYLLRLVPVMLFFCTCYIIALVRSGFYSGIVYQAKPFFLYAPTAIMIGGLIGIKARETDFFDKIEWFTIVSLPVAINYTTMMFTNTSPYENGGFGIADYMHLSYAYMPLLLALVVQIARGKTDFLWFHGLKKAYIIRIILVVLIWMLILGCATRGTILCVLAFFILLVAYMVFLKLFKTVNFKILLLVFGMVVLQFITFTYIYTPQGLTRLDRVNNLTDSIKGGDVETAKDSPGVKEYGLDNLVNLPPSYAADLEKSGVDYKTMDNAWIIGYTIKNRITIYKLAWKEIIERPLTGLGPLGFISKYGNYPHNFVLELFTDLGLILGSIVLLFIVLCFAKLVINCRRDSNTGFMLVFLCGFVAYLMTSGTVWNQPILLFGVSYSLCHIPAKRTSLI